MKKYIILLSLVLSLIYTTQSYSQQFRFGVKTGINFSNMRVSGFTGVTESSRFTFHVGAIVDYSFTKSFSLESGLILNSKGANFEIVSPINNSTIVVTTTQTLSPLYIELPINAVYKVDIKPLKLQLFAGPYFGFGVSGNRETEYTATGLPNGVTLAQLLSAIGVQNETVGLKYGGKDSDDLKLIDIGLNFGAGVEYNNFLFRLQYGLGLSNLSTTSADNEILKNNVFSISVGYMFGK
ncbi:MAG: porin family protein [Bacteroidales bacterium]